MKSKEIVNNLKDARNSEYEVIVIAGQSYTPSEAARYVAQHSKELGWVPAPIALEHLFL